ncbi:chemotaxis protein CheX [uncultured Desulfuromonas sp.]|uniref:chemotaxis protein CheX n=1 Tax=uncultured Desulfuromonas sp. TaxID=181013 RepID=UPI00262F1006|nr:chemotaxis protein CheX [uncultured Desulfuromonas sp.]
MAVKFFGQFLVERGTVGREQILQAIELQEKTNLRFGEMALSMKLMTDSDVERVHLAQRSEDLRFGDMAVKLGIITPEQLQQVLTRQKNSHLYIGEALVKIGALARHDLIRYLDEFRKDQAPFLERRTIVPEGLANAETWAMVADLTYKMLTRVVNLEHRPGPCSVTSSLQSHGVVVAMDFTGALQARYLLSISSGVQAQIARAILQEADVSAEPQEVLDDTVMEFVNIVCGNAVAKAAQMGFQMDIRPPELIEAKGGPVTAKPGQSGLLFPIHVAEGERAEMALFIRG